MPEKRLPFKTQGPILKFIGRDLYKNDAEALSEFIANSWDADATSVSIDIKDGENNEQCIEIRDDGDGMSFEDLENKYLTVDYDKRNNGENLFSRKRRTFMGKKGIGKLASFYFADIVEIYTKKKDGELEAWKIDFDELQEKVDSNREYLLEEIKDTPNDLVQDKGTIIILKRLIEKRKIKRQTISSLRRRIAFKFNLEDPEFKVKVNNEIVDKKKANYIRG